MGYTSRMKVGTWAIVGAAAGVVVAVGLAVHFELSARTRVDNELRGLRTEVTTDVDHHRLSPSQAAALESQLGQVRRQIEEDDVRGAQRLLHEVKADLKSSTRSA